MFNHARNYPAIDWGSREPTLRRRPAAVLRTDEGERSGILRPSVSAGYRGAERQDRQQDSESRADKRRQRHGVRVGAEAEIPGLTLDVAHDEPSYQEATHHKAENPAVTALTAQKPATIAREKSGAGARQRRAGLALQRRHLQRSGFPAQRDRRRRLDGDGGG